MRRIIARNGGLFFSGLELLVIALAWVAGFAVLFIMAVTCLDIILRMAGRPLTGTYDMVRIAGTVGVACAVPYTTAIKGHVAIEFFFQKMGRYGRVTVDTLMRLFCIALFAALTVQSIRYGVSLKAAGQVSATLQWPVFWIPHLIAVCCTATVGVMVFQLFHPGKEMLKP